VPADVPPHSQPGPADQPPVNPYQAPVSPSQRPVNSNAASRTPAPLPSAPPAREQWSTRIGVILAVAGSAVGLGNFLRFPGQAAQNGGGAFMLPYFISLLILGIPLCWAEWAMGRYGGVRGFNSAPGVFTVIWRHPLAKYLGGLALLIPLVIYMYYVVVEAWCLGYALQYLTGDLTVGAGGKVDQVLQQVQQAAPELSAQKATQEAYSKVFTAFTGQAADGAVFQSGQTPLLWVLIFTFAVNFFFIYRGVTRGIETFCKFAMPVMFLCAVCVLIRVLTLGTPDPVNHPEQSVFNGLGAMWNPQPEKLKDPQTWLAAAGQIFFSLSVGFGIIINYASYLRQKDDIALSGLTASSMNEFFEVCLGGLITLPAAFIFLGALAVSFGTFGMGFVALPNVFGLMPAGRFFGFVWFFMLFLAAITSSLSMLQPVIAFFEEGFGLKRHASAALLGLLAAMGCGFVLYFSKGATAMDTFDFWVGSVLIFVLAMAQAILYGWVFGIDRGERELHEGAHIRVPRLVQWVLKFVTPVYLLGIFVLFCWNNVPGYVRSIKENPVVLSSLLFIGTVLAFVLLLVHIAGNRWQREGRFARLDHDAPPAP
jgi:NSS family neurotransmitter:Na+ symporter